MNRGADGSSAAHRRVEAKTANPGRSYPGASYDLVIEALERYGSKVRPQRPRDAMAQCPCPVHGNGDRNPSLHVWWSNGQTSVHCHAGGTGERPHHDVLPVLEPLGLAMSDLFDEPLPPRGGSDSSVKAFRPHRTSRASAPQAAPQDAPDLPEWARPVKSTPKHDLGERLSSTHVVSYLYSVHDSGPEEGAGYWERVDRYEEVYENGVDKTFKRYHWDGTRWSWGAISSRLPKCSCRWHRSTPEDLPNPVLFNLPAVQRAIAAGDEVWVVEGEKDAVTLIGLGLCATTNVSGGGTWDEEYTAVLADARIVLCLDRDRAGWKRGERLAAALHSVARELRVVVPPRNADPAGPRCKDVTDMVTAGMPLSDLEQLELGRVIDLDQHRRERDDADGGGGGGGRGRGSGSGQWDHIPNTRPTYLQRKGAIVEQTWRGKSADEMVPKFAVLIDAHARVARSTYLDDGTEATPVLHDHVVEIHREDPDTGEITEASGVYRIPADEVANARWPERLPLSNLIVGNKRAERDKAWDALVWVTADELRREGKTLPTAPIYAVPGWRESADGPIYVHGAGAIGAGGPVEVETHLDGEFGGMVLPAPTGDVDELREAWAAGMEPLLGLPARIIAPLLGVTMWSSLCGPASHVTHLVGAPGSAKTFAARSVLQLFHPGLLYKTEHQEMASARNSTPIGLTRSLARAKDTVLFIDDFAPDDAGGGAAMAAKHAHLARVVHNRSKRSKAQRFGSGTDNDPAPRGSVITTGELTAAGSAETRCLNVPVADGDLNGEAVQQRVENPRTAAARGLMGASFLCWAAGRHAALQEQVRAWTYGEGSYHDRWMARLRDLPHTPGIRARIADGVATSTAGIRVLHDWLLEVGVIDDVAAQQLWDWAVGGLDEVARAQDVEATDPAEHFLAALRAVVGSRRGYLADHRGDTPVPEDLDFASRYGWSWQPKPGGRGEFGIAVAPHDSGQWVHNGDLLGEVCGEQIKLLPDACLAAVRAAAVRADQRWADTVASLSASMHARGWLLTTTTSHGTVERRVSVHVCGAKTRAWVLNRALFDGDSPEDAPTGPGPGPLPRFDPADVGASPSVVVSEPAPKDSEHNDDEVAPAAARNSEENVVRLSELVEQLHSLGGDPLDHLTTRHVPTGPCAVCQQTCELEISGARVHLGCLLRQLNAPAATAGPIPAPAETTGVDPAAPDAESAGAGPDMTAAPDPAPTAPQPGPGITTPAAARGGADMPRPGGAGGRWKYAAAVLDTSGVYLPDGRRVGAGALEHAGQVLAAGERLAIGHPGGPGQLWCTEALCEQLGLIADPDPGTGDPDEQRRQTLERLASVGRVFLAPAVAAGWRVDGGVLRPVTRLRRTAGDGNERVLELLIEPYQWVWDPRNTGLASGAPGTATALPDIADPAARWSELARRAGRAAELLGVNFRMSAGLVGADLFDVAQRRRRRAAERGTAVDKAGRNRARVVERAGATPVLRGQRKGLPVERPISWTFPVSATTLAVAEWAHGFDVRKQWLPAAKSIELGYCTDEAPNPIHHDDTARIRTLLTAEPAKLPFGLWRVLLPAWDETRLPAPHPAQRPGQTTRAWVTTPTLRLLLEDPDTRHGAGYTLDELDPEEAWTWPEQGRLLDGHWYTTLRNALEASKDDPAMEAHLKAVYAGYFGRLASEFTADSARPWHHQPVWQQAIIAAARAEEWRKLHRAAWEHNLWPVVVTADEVVYLASGVDADKPVTVAPAADNGRVGALRHSRSLQLDETLKDRVRAQRGDLVKALVWTHLVGGDPEDNLDPVAAATPPAQATGSAGTVTASGDPVVDHSQVA